MKNHIVNVVVNFLSRVISFFFFSRGGGGMVMYANKVETKEKEKLPEIKSINNMAVQLLSHY